MIRVPPWLAILVGAVVFLFGVFRIYIGFKPSPEQAQQKGLYGIGGRRHILIGVVYVIMGALLAASGMGFHVFGGRAPTPPAPEPAQRGVLPVEVYHASDADPGAK